MTMMCQLLQSDKYRDDGAEEDRTATPGEP